jgi:hypothetical protein
MIASGIPSMILPRSQALTDLLIDPRGTPVSNWDLIELRRKLEGTLRASVTPIKNGQKVCIDTYWFRSSGAHGPLDDTFKWSPSTARRPIALEAVRTWLANRGTTPARAVALTVQRLVRSGTDPSFGRATLGCWLAGLGLGARSIVEAEAVTLATQLITALDWTRLTQPVVGDDRTISFASSPRIFVRGRVDVRSTVAPLVGKPGSERSSVLFALMSGRPQPTSCHELGLVALTVALRSRAEPPIRVVGWWPQCGRALSLPVVAELLDDTVKAIDARLRSPRHPHSFTLDTANRANLCPARADDTARLAS